MNEQQDDQVATGTALLRQQWMIRIKVLVTTLNPRMATRVADECIIARDLETARRVGEAYCRRYGHQLLAVRPLVIADESILTMADNPDEKPRRAQRPSEATEDNDQDDDHGGSPFAMAVAPRSRRRTGAEAVASVGD